jgi:hypothetical protein
MKLDDIRLSPHCAPCYNFLSANEELKKTVWLVPHIIKSKYDNELMIIWCCNWGERCEAQCLYSRAKKD